MKKSISAILATLALTTCFSAACFAGEVREYTPVLNQTIAKVAKVKNVIMMVPDGQSVGGTTLARWYKGGTQLAVDELACGLVRTYSADAPIADSAPASTAYATGFKSHAGFVGVMPEVNNMPGTKPLAAEDKRRPVANILEAARLAGKATGIIATSAISHATPADFSAHDPNRGNYDNISEQQVYQGIDVVLGGGESFLTKKKRKDKEDLVAEIKLAGYEYIKSIEEMNASKSNKLWGMFAKKDIAYDFDRDPSKQPSLAEMTAKAISTLNNNKKGFFLFVEGSKVDWAAHANDPIGLISETIAYDNAVKVALDFAKKDENTVVISVTDHGNGGISIGCKGTDKNYGINPLNEYIAPLQKAKLTGAGLESKFNDDRSNVVEVMRDYYGISDLSTEEIATIKATKAGKMNYSVGPMMSKRANLGWTTNGHTGEDVPLYVYAPAKARVYGVFENTDIAKYMEKLLGVKLSTTTDKLFVPATAAFEAKGAAVALDKSNEHNLVLVISKDKQRIEIPINKNIAIINGNKVKLDGVVVYNGMETYVPQMAIDLLK